MKNKNRFFVYPFILIGLILTFTNSCEKDENKKVEKKDPIILWANPADIILPTALSTTQLNATANVPGNFVYTPALGVVLNIGANQDLKVDFTPIDSTNYTVASKTIKINVTAEGTVTDIDGNVYNIVTIGTQTWMVENLKTTKYNDGTAISNITDPNAWPTYYDEYCWYNNDIANKTNYGALYNYHTVVDSRNLCPMGWHVPTDNEWITLISYLRGESVAGGKLKEIGTTHWQSPNTGATNETGFTALPGGGRHSIGVFFGIGYGSYWWSSTDNDTYFAWYRYIDSSRSSLKRGSDSKDSGFSVRCVRDL